MPFYLFLKKKLYFSIYYSVFFITNTAKYLNLTLNKYISTSVARMEDIVPPTKKAKLGPGQDVSGHDTLADNQLDTGIVFFDVSKNAFFKHLLYQ